MNNFKKSKQIPRFGSRMAWGLLISVLLCVVPIVLMVCLRRPTTKHLLSGPRLYPEKTLTGFTEEQEQRILEAFNVVIPESENAHVYSFYYNEGRIRKKADDRLDFILEIEGVEDHSAFYEANIGRVKENGLAGKSWNELLDRNPPKYYVTYYESFYSDQKRQDDDEKQMIATLGKLYYELKKEIDQGVAVSRDPLVCRTA